MPVWQDRSHVHPSLGREPSQQIPPSGFEDRVALPVSDIVRNTSVEITQGVEETEQLNDLSARRPSHFRSYSHPLASSVSSNIDTTESKEKRSHQGIRRQRIAAERVELPKRYAESDLISGRCATCDSLVRWPKRLTVFRCTVCLMINDLKPIRTDGVTTTGRAPSISTGLTLTIAIDCIRRHIRSRSVQVAQSLRIPREQTQTSLSTNHVFPESSWVRRSHTMDQSDDKQVVHRSIAFRKLEEHVINCFSNVDCLNSSFTKSKTAPHRNEQSASGCGKGRMEGRDKARHEDFGTFPELDAKTLMIGDIAENGFWWTGRLSPMQAGSPKASGRSKGSVKQPLDSPSLSRACVDWSGLNDWYNIICNLYGLVLQESRRDEYHDLEPRILSSVCEELKQPCTEVQDILLQVTESLLRRPGRSIGLALECRFLLIILANPLLRSSSLFGSWQKDRREPQTSILDRSPAESQTTAAWAQASRSICKDSREIFTSSILKRTLGLIANSSSSCQKACVVWLSCLDKSPFEDMIELVQRFVSRRLLKATGRKRRNSDDTTLSGLIPTTVRNAPATPAQLHDTIGGGGRVKHRARVYKTSYGDDWQLKAAAQFILLLSTAANDIASQDVGTIPKLRARSGANHVHYTHHLSDRPQWQRKVAPSIFYNSRVDLCDLVSDFEAWEARRGSFCFCQYPMLLSLRAKICIMEHEARRQMEIKAREAFFNSIIGRRAISQYLILRVRRTCLAEDSLRTISETVGAGQEEIKKGLRIEFLGEEGLDSGGLRKEWFLLLIREVFDADYGLFQYDEQSRHCYFNPNSLERSEQFFLIGVLFGLAIYNSTILDVALPPFAFRKLLASAPGHHGPFTHLVRPQYKCDLNDLAEFRPALANGLRRLLDFEGDVQETFLQDFVAPIEKFGTVQHIPLCPDGENRPVTAANRREYVDLYVRYMLDTSVQRQFEPFKRGFFIVCGGNALSLFQPEEIELLIRGSEETLDISSLKAVAIHENWASQSDPAAQPPLKWFWETFAEANPSHQRRLLSFITASDRLPAMGATGLVIRIACLGDDFQRYPTARTCFNMIGLFNYRSKGELEQKLWGAVMESEGFGIK